MNCYDSIDWRESRNGSSAPAGRMKRSSMKVVTFNLFLCSVNLLLLLNPTLTFAQDKRHCFGVQYKVGLSHQKWFAAKGYGEDIDGSFKRSISRRNSNRVPSFSHELLLVGRLDRALSVEFGMGFSILSSQQRFKVLPVSEINTYCGDEYVIFGDYELFESRDRDMFIPYSLGCGKRFALNKETNLSAWIMLRAEQYIYSLNERYFTFEEGRVHFPDEGKVSAYAKYSYSIRPRVGVERMFKRGASAEFLLFYGFGSMGLTPDSPDFRVRWKNAGIELSYYFRNRR